jgi:L-amino acid N-acyltransferase YncA
MAAHPKFLIRKAKSEDASEIADIYNQGMDERIATFVTDHVTPKEMVHKITSDAEKHPFYVATSIETTLVLGWSSISPYSPRSCYNGIGEVSVYVKKNFRKQGIGEALAKRAFGEAEKLGYWKLMVRIFSFNRASINLFRKIGYVETGLHLCHGKLDGKWLDVLELEHQIPRNIT